MFWYYTTCAGFQGGREVVPLRGLSQKRSRIVHTTSPPFSLLRITSA